MRHEARVIGERLWSWRLSALLEGGQDGGVARVQGFLVEICYLNGCEPAIDNGGQPVQVAGCGASEGWRKGTLRVGAEHMAHRRLKIMASDSCVEGHTSRMCLGHEQGCEE